MKRFFVFFLSAIILLSLAACGLPEVPTLPELPAAPSAEPAAAATPVPSAEPVLLELVVCPGDADGESFLGAGRNGEDFVARFEAENPRVSLTLSFASPEETAQRVAAGDAPDVLIAADFAAFASEGLLLPVRDCCPEELCADFAPAFLEAGAIDSAVWALPDLVSGWALYCNLDLLAEAETEIPGDWDTLEAACRAVLERCGGAIPWGLAMTAEDAASCFACYAWAGGGGFLGADGGWEINSAANAEALDFAIGLANKGLTNPNPAVESLSGLEELFTEGRIAMLVAPGSLSERLAAEDLSFAVTAAAIPARAGCTAASVGSVESRVMVFRDDGAADPEARAEAVGRFLAFYYESALYAERARAGGAFPATASGAAAFAAAEPSLAAWPDILRSCRLLPSGKDGWDAVCEGLYSTEQLSLIGGDTRASLDALQELLAGVK